MPLSRRELDAAWSAVRAELRKSTTDLGFHLWLDPLELADREGELLYVRCPRHIRTLVEERHLPLVRAAAERALGGAAAVRIVGEDWVPDISQSGAGPARSPDPVGVELLNPRYTFEQFVIGEGNRLAHAAALAAAEQPAQAYNPLFLYGPPGLGKTHLLQAIGNYVQRYGNGLRVRYATSEAFTSGFVGALRTNTLEDFKRRFRAVDVLLVDDVQFFGDRVRTQEEFFHTFNALYEAGCQVAVSSDRSPTDLAALERRLSQRFGSGLVAAVEAPTLDVRLAILRKRARIDRIESVDDTVLEEVARQVTSSVRALEGALTRVVAYGSLRGEPPTPQLARKLLSRLYAEPGVPTECRTISDIQVVTADHFGVTTDELRSRERTMRVAFPRQVAMYLARALTDETLPTIGDSFGGRDHSTVLHAQKRITQELKQGSKRAQAVIDLQNKLRPQPVGDRGE